MLMHSLSFSFFLLRTSLFLILFYSKHLDLNLINREREWGIMECIMECVEIVSSLEAEKKKKNILFF